MKNPKYKLWMAIARGLGSLLISVAAVASAYRSSKNETRRRW